MTTDPMVTWLSRALDHAEEVAGEAAAGPWERDATWDDAETGLYGREVTGPTGFKLYDEGGHTSRDAVHVALHDPRAALARVEAEKRLVAAYESGDLDHLVMQDVLRTIAYGHRFDIEGHDRSWAPEGVEASA